MTGPPVTVLLSEADLAECHAAARKRADLHEAAGRGNCCTFWRHLQGCVSEFALAKYLGPDVLQHWRDHSAFQTEANFRAIREDVRGFQVRSTVSRTGNLLLLDKDDPAMPFVLARMPGLTDTDTGTTAEVRLVGWLLAADGKTPENKATARRLRLDADYVVPADDLIPLTELPT